jgi:hypothetical protein
VSRKDIATLLQHGNVGLARAKAQSATQEDLLGDLLEVLEMHVGVLLEHFTELDQRFVFLILLFHESRAERLTSSVPSAVVAEAASSIIFAAPHTSSKGTQLDISLHAMIFIHDYSDLNLVRDILVQRFGPDFARSAICNHNNCVSPKVGITLKKLCLTSRSNQE